MPHPLLYEINTRCWLRELSDQTGHTVTLATVPEAEFDSWRRHGFTHVWLMGVWASGPRARAQALAALRVEIESPAWRDEDIGGSPYAIADYSVPAVLGGEEGLKQFRQRLDAYGLKLVLDFVPNHFGVDHPWLSQRPELFVQSQTQVPETFLQATPAGPRWLAHGKDPYFPAWTDTAQLDYRRADTQAAMTDLLLSVAARCDGVRCDMAMLVLQEVFAKTWAQFPATSQTPRSSTAPPSAPPPPPSPPSDPLPVPLSPPLSSLAPHIVLGRAAARPYQPSSRPTPQPASSSPSAGEFWSSAIAAARRAHPGFLFLAEAYWGLESRLQALGFDYTYDKALYDKLIARDARGVQRHLLQMPASSLAASAHFLENHDEARIASVLSPAEHRAAALVILGLPGLRLLHDGQLAGARRKIPVQWLRRPAEESQPVIAEMYDQFLTVLLKALAGGGHGELLTPRPAWPGNSTGDNFVVVQWQGESPGFDLVAVNLASHRSQCYTPLNVPGLAAHNWSMKDLLGPEQYVRSGDDLQNQGLYLDLPPHGAQLFHFQPAS